MRLAIIITIAVAALAQETPIIRVPVRLVTVPTLVLSNTGRVIAGLDASDFRIFDNGHSEKIALDSVNTPVSVAVAVQANFDVRQYFPFIAKVGSVVDALLVGERGHAAVIAYNDDVAIRKPFSAGNVQSVLRGISATGRNARMIDAAMRGIALLKDRPRTRARVLLLIGQPIDRGSESTLNAVEEEAEKENVTIYALALPEIGKSFVSDTFAIHGLSGADSQGFKASANLEKLVPALSHTADSAKKTDPFSILTIETGGTQLHFRRQNELEQAIAIVGIELRTSYLLSYQPSSTVAGYHAIQVEVDVPGVKAYARPGYRADSY